jgi:hypothetical protein
VTVTSALDAAVPQDRVVLTTEEYLLAWQHLRLGLLHWNLRPPGGVPRTVEQRTRTQRQAWEALRARMLADTRQLNPGPGGGAAPHRPARSRAQCPAAQRHG